ncbi:MAG: multifunctional oxoglutarate decarboxylase/oxoglutarate dehydrogenase thiamine pyrophosphate-binding subunit/dihydrolipoyllysine-residue succinyltransferase subunit, partial [Gordonia sp. (in: high G+C Gram-positive bacteria)]
MSSSSISDFGQNEWLVEEMYQRFKEDPSSVDPSWHDFLKSYGAEGNGSEEAKSPPKSAAGSPPKSAPKAGAGSEPKAGASSNGSAAPKSSVNGSAAKPAVDPTPASKAAAGQSEHSRDASSSTTTSSESTTDKSAESVSKDAAPAAKKSAPAPRKDAPTKKEAPAKKSAPTAGDTPTEASNKVLRGAAAAVAKNMAASLQIPTATSVRAVPAKLMIDNRVVINNHLARTRGGKVSFTHILGYAIVQAIKSFPNLNRHFEEVDGKPNVVTPAHTNLGLAIDLPGKDGSRTLVVAAIKRCETMNFAQFHAAYEDIVRRARDGKLTAEDFAGVTISLTNPGTIGTVHSVPRLMKGQGAIVGAGAMEYPAEFQGASDEQISALGVGKLMTLTSTYDHRIIQGAESGDFLRTIHQLLLSDEFFDQIFTTLHIPYEPIRWRRDIPEGAVDKNARVLELIAAYRNRGHLMADIDPLMIDSDARSAHPDLNVLTYDLTLWDLDRSFNVGGFHGENKMKLRDVLSILRDSYCR